MRDNFRRLMLKEGALLDLFLMLVIISAYAYYTWIHKQGKKLPPIRRIPALDAIEEGIGRAEEMGRPVHYCPGHTGRLSGEFGPAILAALNIYKYTVGLCALK